MAKNMYFGVSGVARKATQPYIGVGGVARKVKAGHIGVGDVARQFFVGGIAMSGLATGTTVKLEVNGVETDFIIVHKGLPSSMYDSSCNGIWLLMKDIYVDRSWDSSNNDYANSDIHTYLVR